MRAASRLPGRGRVEPAPGAAELAGGAVAGALCDPLHVEAGVAQKLAREHDPQPVEIVGNAHARMGVEEAREMARARGSDGGEALEGPGAGRIRGDRVLHAMDRRMDVVAALEPGRYLRIGAGATEVDDE